MRFAFVWAGALLGSATLLGCSTSGIDADPVIENSVEDGEVNSSVSLAFEGAPSIDLAPGETREVTALAWPTDQYELYFALIDAPSDTSLDASHVFTDKEGRATVQLHAPSAPASFKLRAFMKEGASAELDVTVSKEGLGVIEVIPEYDGKRAVTEWVGSVIVGQTCDDLAGQLPGEPEGSLVATSAEKEHPLIQSVPAGPKLAIAVRALHYAWGCTDVKDIAASVVTKVKVHVVDVPPALDRTSLDVLFSYTPQAAPYNKMLKAAEEAFLEAFFPAGKPEEQTLLDTMAALSADPASFAAMGDQNGWGAIASAHFAQLSAPLGTTMGEWIDLGLASAAPELTGKLVSIDNVPGKALLLVDQIGGMDAAAAGAPPAHLVSWSSALDDKVTLNGTVYWLPSRYVGEACRLGADQDFGGVLDSMSDALAKAAGCSDLAASLGGTPACDVTCLTDLCRAALASRWKAALDASAVAETVGTIDISATGLVKVDDIATPIALSGSWLGHVSDGYVTAEVTGPVEGVLSEPDEPNPSDPPSGDPPQ